MAWFEYPALSYGNRQLPTTGVTDRIRSFFARGQQHRDLLETADVRIGVSGIRGKSSTAQRLGEILHDRGYDTYTKITGDKPTSYLNGRKIPIQRRGPRVTLYENLNLVREFVTQLASAGAGDVVTMENQAITEYTMRMVNEQFLDPDILLFCNIRQDHNDTLGKRRQTIARSFARSVPAGCHVINGEQHPVINDYLTAEIEARGATIETVDIPEHHRDLIGAETIYALNNVLEYLDEPVLPPEELQSMLDAIQPEWTTLPGGRVFNGAKVNEIESTELFRRQLVGTEDDAELVCPFVFLRHDRRGRTASFVEYINILADRGVIDRVHVGGAYTGVFSRRVDVPATQHDTDTEPASDVLDDLLATEQPVLFMANTVHPFMRDLADEVAYRERGGPAPLPKY